jgi:hypothetical protein
MMDTWELDDGNLSLISPLSTLVNRRPYTSTEDKKGHEVFLGAKFPKSFQRWVTELKEAPGSDYRTNADVVRDAIHLGLQVISLRAKQSALWGVQAAIAQQQARIFQHTRIYREVDEIAEQLGILVKAGDDKQAKSDLVDYINVFLDHPERNKYIAVLRERLAADRRLQGLLKVLEAEVDEYIK